MTRILGGIALTVVLVLAALAIYVYGQVSSLEVAEVTDDVHVIHGLGGNVGILRTDAGSVVVDTMTFQMQGREVRERARRLAGPVQMVVNTHYHLDHTHGNPAFAAGLEVVSTERTRAYLDALDAAYWEGAAAATLPNATFEDERTVELGGKTLRLLHRTSSSMVAIPTSTSRPAARCASGARRSTGSSSSNSTTSSRATVR
jgi:glyoxylase-like metal-dependent hydrolase (beta-lactamase superfamily II)